MIGETDEEMLDRLEKNHRLVADLGVPYRPGAAIELYPDTFGRLLVLARRGLRKRSQRRVTKKPSNT